MEACGLETTSTVITAPRGRATQFGLACQGSRESSELILRRADQVDPVAPRAFPLPGQRRVHDQVPERLDRRHVEASEVRIWASHDQVAREHLERVDRRRTEYLQRQCRAIVDDVDLADDVATMIYLIMIGASHIVPQMLVRDQARMWDRLINYLETQSDRREA